MLNEAIWLSTEFAGRDRACSVAQWGRRTGSRDDGVRGSFSFFFANHGRETGRTAGLSAGCSLGR